MSKGREHGEWASPGEVTEGSFEREHFCKVKTRGGVLEVQTQFSKSYRDFTVPVFLSACLLLWLSLPGGKLSEKHCLTVFFRAVFIVC